MWQAIATDVANGNNGNSLHILAQSMPADQVDQGRRLADEWLTQHHLKEETLSAAVGPTVQSQAANVQQDQQPSQDNLSSSQPKYDARYAFDYDTNNPLHIDVVDKKVVLTYTSQYRYSIPSVVLYNPSRKIFYYIPIQLPNLAHPPSFQALDTVKPTTISVPELEGATVQNTNESPDGFTFSADTMHPAITKGSYSLQLQPTNAMWDFTSLVG